MLIFSLSRWRGWGCALCWALAAPVWAQASDPAPAEVTATEPASQAGTVARLQFEVAVTGPAALRDFLLQHLDLMRFQTLPDLDLAELRRLVAGVPTNASALLATQGYMAPDVKAQLLPQDALAPDPQRWQVLVQLTPGPRTRIEAVRWSWAGDIAQRPDAQAQRETVEREWSLPVGLPFTQDGWDQAKAAALRTLVARRFPLGRLADSRAEIDPQTHTARLSLSLDSGRLFTLGEVQVSGTERYSPDMVRRLVRQAGLHAGDEYDQTKVLDAQRVVAASGYFESVFIEVEPGDDANRARVQVKLREAPLQKLVLGVGVSTDNGPRLSLEHTHHRAPGLGWRAQSALTLTREDRQAQLSLTVPVDDRGWQWVGSAQLGYQTDGALVTRNDTVRWGQTHEVGEFSRHYYVQHNRSRTDGGSQTPAQQSALSANLGWTLRRLDSLVFPQSGYSLGLELGLGYTLDAERAPYARARVRGLAYVPLDGGHAGRLALRGDLGAVVARARTPVPSNEMFLTGGDTSVRGYSLRSIGVPVAAGDVTAGRYLWTASAEWQRPLVWGGQRSDWEHTLFVDAGAVANRVRGLHAQVGVGTGARYRSPVGPLQLDLAYGQATRRWRLHLSLGFKF